MQRPSTTQLHYGILLALIAAASCLRILVCLQHNPMDYLLLLDPARHWMHGLHFPKGGYSGAADPIGYQVYIFILRKLTGDNRLLVGLASALLSVVMPWTFYRAARNLGLSKLPSLWVWALIAWTPSLLAIYHYIMMETLLLVIEGVALWMTARHLRKGDAQSFLISVGCWTLAVLTKPTVLPLAGVCVLWSCWKRRPSLRTAVAAAGLVIVLLVPQSIRTEVALGFVAPLGNPWLTRIQHRSGVKTVYVDFYPHQSSHFHFQADPVYSMTFSSPSCYVHPLEPLSDWAIRRASGDTTMRLHIDSAFGSREWKNAYAALPPDGEEWMKQWGENIVLFFFAPSWPEINGPSWEDRLESPTRWIWAPLILFVLIFDTRDFLRRQFDLVPVATTLFTLSLALQNAVTAEGRYRKPLEPMLLLNLVWICAVSFSSRRKSDGEASAGSTSSASDGLQVEVR